MERNKQLEAFAAPYRWGNIILKVFFGLLGLFFAAQWIGGVLRGLGAVLLLVGLVGCGMSPDVQPYSQGQRQEMMQITRQTYGGASAAVQGFHIPSGNSRPVSK